MNQKLKRWLAQKKKDGVSAKSIIIPVVVVILLMHAAIVANTLRINRAGQGLSETTQSNIAYTQIVKTLQTSSETLADKARLYVNTGDKSYLVEYMTELRGLRGRDAEILASLSVYETEQSREQLQSALEIATRRSRMECRALRL